MLGLQFCRIETQTLIETGQSLVRMSGAKPGNCERQHDRHMSRLKTIGEPQVRDRIIWPSCCQASVACLQAGLPGGGLGLSFRIGFCRVSVHGTLSPVIRLRGRKGARPEGRGRGRQSTQIRGSSSEHGSRTANGLVIAGKMRVAD
mgnify:CR=1 FL=1